MIMLRRIASCLSFVVLIGSAGTLHANPLDAPDIVYIDGAPCNSPCQAYMAWSRKTLAAGSAQHPPAGATRRATEVNPARSRPAARSHIARQAARPTHDIHRDTGMASARAAVSRPMQRETSNAERAESSNTKQTESQNDRQAELPNTFQANSPNDSQAEASGAKQTDTSDARKPEASSASQSEMPNAPQAKPSSTDQAEAPASLSRTDATAASGTRPVREQIMAAATIAEQLTGATSAVAELNAMGSDKSKSSEGTNGNMIASTSPSAADTMVAVLISRPEIKSMSDLTGKNFAIDKRRSESESNVRIALVAAGAPEVELSSGNSEAIDRVVGGEVPAAVVALVSPKAAEAFPDVPGFRVFRIELSPHSMKTETDKP
jgi:hypothetical protein